MPRSDKALEFRARLPFNFYVPLAPSGPFFKEDGNITEEFLSWLRELVRVFEIFENTCVSWDADEPICYVDVRQANNKDGRGVTKTCSGYDPRGRVLGRDQDRMERYTRKSTRL